MSCVVGVKAHFFAWRCPVFQEPFVEETVLPYQMVLVPLLKIRWPYMYGFISELSISISLIYMSILLPVPHCFDYSIFVVSFQIGKCESSNSVLFQDCFHYLGLLVIPYEFQDQLSHFCKRLTGLIELNLYIILGSADLLTI